jgi:hypothetical protein
VKDTEKGVLEMSQELERALAEKDSKGTLHVRMPDGSLHRVVCMEPTAFGYKDVYIEAFGGQVCVGDWCEETINRCKEANRPLRA